MKNKLTNQSIGYSLTRLNSAASFIREALYISPAENETELRTLQAAVKKIEAIRKSILKGGQGQ